MQLLRNRMLVSVSGMLGVAGILLAGVKLDLTLPILFGFDLLTILGLITLAWLLWLVDTTT